MYLYTHMLPDHLVGNVSKDKITRSRFLVYQVSIYFTHD